MSLQPEGRLGRQARAGCGLAGLAAFATVALLVFFIMFIDSGADLGEVVLDVERAYVPGTVTFVSDGNFYLVRLEGSEPIALSDLDAANRIAQGRRCRVHALDAANPALGPLLDKFGARFSAQAAGANLLFQEECNGAVYDVTGVRVDADGPNLDRFRVSVRDDGRVAVETHVRTCTAREGSQTGLARDC